MFVADPGHVLIELDESSAEDRMVDGISGDHLLIAPPAVITAEQIDWAVEQLRAAIEEVSPEP